MLWPVPVIPTLGSQRHEEQEFKVILNHIVSSKPARVTRDPALNTAAEAGDSAQRLRALSGLAEDMGWFPALKW